MSIEIVQTDAEQPWHTRVLGRNGEPVMHSENYADDDTACSAVAVLAEAFGITMSRPPVRDVDDETGTLLGLRGEAPDGNVYTYPIRFVDEREQPDD